MHINNVLINIYCCILIIFSNVKLQSEETVHVTLFISNFQQTLWKSLSQSLFRSKKILRPEILCRKNAGKKTTKQTFLFSWKNEVRLEQVVEGHLSGPVNPFFPTVPTFAVRETASLGIMGAPRVPPLKPSESIVLSKHYRLWGV